MVEGSVSANATISTFPVQGSELNNRGKMN